MDQYLPIVLLLVVALAFAAGSFAASKVLGPSRPTGAKTGPYESGIVSSSPAAARFPVRFFMVAMIFIIFDIEVIFLYPWAVIYHQLNTFGLAEMAVFAAIVFVSFAYLVSNGALDWGPVQRRVGRPPADLARTTTSTVRRVPRPDEVADSPATRAVDPEREVATAGAAAVSAPGGGDDGSARPVASGAHRA